MPAQSTLHKTTTDTPTPAASPVIRPDSPWLAPLAGYSDLPFRLLCREYGCRTACTEMVSARGLLHSSPGTDPLLNTTAEDQPLVVQLFGSQPEELSRAVSLLKERGFSHFDLNAGCPVRKVLSGGSGAALLKDSGRLRDIVQSMAEQAAPGSVGVKIRSGWSGRSEQYHSIAPLLEAAGAAWITLHPRYGTQGFTGTAHWSHLKRLKEVVDVPVLASGDLFTARDGLRCLEETGVDGIMFARGAMRDPAIFRKFAYLLSSGEELPWSGQDLLALIRRHIALSKTLGHERQSLLKMRTFLPRYLKGIAGARTLRKAVTSCNSWEALEKIIDRLAHDLLVGAPD